MSQTDRIVGINLKSMPLGESDRLVTLLSPEQGIVRAVAPGARKYQSRLRGRSEPFVVNQLLVVRGRSLARITQAETLRTYSGLSEDLGKLAAGQYLAEIVLELGLSDRPQPDLYELLAEHLQRIERLPPTTSKSEAGQLLAHLSQAIFHLLANAGVAPQVHACCRTRNPITADFATSEWKVGFSFEAGGAIDVRRLEMASELDRPHLNRQLNAIDLALMQALSANVLPDWRANLPASVLDHIELAWVRVERLLRDYLYYQFSLSIRSGTLVDTLVAARI